MSKTLSALRSSLTAPSAEKEQLKIVIVGHVDHGKSTLVGRIFHDTGSLPDGKFEAITKMCEKRGMPFEWSFLMDALQAERDQGITIDTSQIWFRTKKRDYVIIDAPGHKEFLKNMISGAAMSEAALLIIDAKEGVKEQSRRHGFLLHLLGVRQIAVAVNKMDLIGYDQKSFERIEKEYREYLAGIGVTPTYVIPISAREGDLITKPSANMPWYKGPSVVEALDSFRQLAAPTDLPLRVPVQDVYKFDERRIIVGRVESGKIKVGDRLIFSPTNKTARVNTIEAWPENGGAKEAYAGMSVGFTLDEQIFVERGQVASLLEDAPALTNIFRARLFWLHEKPLKEGSRYKMKLATAEYQVEAKKIEKVINTADLSHDGSSEVAKSAVGEVVFRIRGMASLDEFNANAGMGRFVLLDGYDVAGGGIIDMQGFSNQRADIRVKSTNIHAFDFRVTAEQRAMANGHKGGVLWFSGLSGSGKSTIANELQNALFRKGYQVYVLDGDNIRRGLNSDLGFEHKDRTENIRRVGEVAALFANAGTIVISAFISPYRADRAHARAACPEGFHTIYIKADLNTCESRDPKGLYKMARKGEIAEFTGISAPYEEPEDPDLVVDTAKNSIEESVAMLVSYVEENMVKPVKDLAAGYPASGI